MLLRVVAVTLDLSSWQHSKRCTCTNIEVAAECTCVSIKVAVDALSLLCCLFFQLLHVNMSLISSLCIDMNLMQWWEMVQGTAVNDPEKQMTRTPDDKEPLAALAFKIMADQFQVCRQSTYSYASSISHSLIATHLCVKSFSCILSLWCLSLWCL